MPLLSAFFGFQGRITRRTFWTGLFILTAISPFAFSTLISADPFADIIGKIQQYGIKGLLWSVALIFGLACLLTKRLHDRNKTGLYAVLFYGPALLKALEFYTGVSAGGEWLSFVRDWGWLLGLQMGAVGLWFLIELGFYGPVDPNKYGADPRND